MFLNIMMMALLRAYIGDVQFKGQELSMSGEEKEVLVRSLIIHRFINTFKLVESGGYMKALNIQVKQKYNYLQQWLKNHSWPSEQQCFSV